MKAVHSLAAGLFAISSFAAYSGAVLASDTRLSIDVPRSAISESPLAQLSHGAPTDFEITASNWAPQSFDGFKSLGLPALSVSGVREVFREGAGALAVKLGAGYSQLGRTSSIDYGGGPIEVSQRDHLLTARLGLEYSHALSGAFSPYFSASLIPTYSVVPRTAAGESTGAFGVPLEAGLGVMTSLHALGLERMKLNLGGIVTSGNIGASAYSGIGAIAGLRLSI